MGLLVFSKGTTTVASDLALLGIEDRGSLDRLVGRLKPFVESFDWKDSQECINRLALHSRSRLSAYQFDAGDDSYHFLFVSMNDAALSDLERLARWVVFQEYGLEYAAGVQLIITE